MEVLRVPVWELSLDFASQLDAEVLSAGRTRQCGGSLAQTRGGIARPRRCDGHPGQDASCSVDWGDVFVSNDYLYAVPIAASGTTKNRR